MTQKTSFIKLKLLSAFILFCLVPILLVSINAYVQVRHQITSSTFEELDVISKLKSQQIERYFSQSKSDLETISKSPYVQEILIHSKQLTPKQISMLHDHILKFIQSRDIYELYILNETNHTVLAVHSTTPSIQETKKSFQTSKDGIYISDIYKGHENSKDYLFTISIPIKDNTGRYTGAIIAEYIANPLFDLVQDRTGLGTSGETQLGKKINDKVIFLNPLRADSMAALSRKVHLGSDVGLPIQSSSTGHIGKGYTIDYLGHEVMASWRFIQTPGWGLVVKIDKKEAFNALDKYLYAIAATALILLLFGIGLSYKISYSLMRPIRLLDDSAHYDPLTRLANRRYLMDIIQQQIKRQHKRPTSQFTLLFLDLDGFKAINDTHGHDIGDWLLQTVASRLKNIVRSSDFVARLGGDEFVILLIDIHHQPDILSIAQKIIDEINAPFIYHDIHMHIGISIGISTYAANTHLNGESLLKKADAAMYTAKQAGKNQFCFEN